MSDRLKKFSLPPGAFKSACFFCPGSKRWELFWLAAHHPDLLERALFLERNALTGRHSRFDEIEFGASWDEVVRNADHFPSSKTTVGLGRSFAWNQWARVNGVVDDDFRVKRGEADRARFLASAAELQRSDTSCARQSSDHLRDTSPGRERLASGQLGQRYTGPQLLDGKTGGGNADSA